MRKEKALYILLGILFITYVVVEYYSPKPLDWSVTFSEKDKNPYGGFILFDRLGDFFSEKEVSFNTLYEASTTDNENVLIITDQFDPSEADLSALFQILKKGGAVCISSHTFSEVFLDTLGLSLQYNPFSTVKSDSIPVAMGKKKAFFPANFIVSYFDPTTLEDWEIGASADEPILIYKKINEGRLVLSSTPLAFSNYGLMEANTAPFITEVLRQLPNGAISYNRFYQSGKPEAKTPLRYLLSQAPLRWAIYLTLLVIVFYLIIGSQRVQRMIPILESNENTTVHFIKTIGGLYHREGNHKNAANKIIQHFLKTLSTQYYIPAFTEVSFQKLSARSGVPVEKVIETFNLIEAVKQSKHISEERLKQLYEKITMFKLQQR